MACTDVEIVVGVLISWVIGHHCNLSMRLSNLYKQIQLNVHYSSKRFFKKETCDKYWKLISILSWNVEKYWNTNVFKFVFCVMVICVYCDFHKHEKTYL